MNEILPTGLAWPGQNQVLLRTIVPVRDNGSILLVGLDDGSTTLTRGSKLGFGALGRVTDTLGAADVLAVRAFLGVSECGAALVASTANTHADRLIHAKNSLVRRGGLPLGGGELEPESFSELLSALLEELILG